MAFDLERFYRELDEHYAAHDNEAVEDFLKKSREKAYEDGLVMPVNHGCPSCVPTLEPNWNYVSVCNEMACFYRGLSRFQDSLDTFSLAQKELESLYRQNTPEYATVLLNKAGTCRYMGDLKQAMEYFRKAAGILERASESSESETGGKAPDRQILAGLYNNMGLLYLDMKEFQDAVSCFQKALPLVEADAGKITELGSTWNNLAAAYQALGEREQAGKAVDCAITILGGIDDGKNPHYPAALNTRGTFFFHAGEYEAALGDFREALEKTKMVYGENIEYAYGCDNCAAVCWKLGRGKEAENWYRKGAEIRKCLGVQA